MAVIVGIFYQRAPRLSTIAAVQAAVTTVTKTLKSYRHVVFNIANEQNSGNWSGSAYEFTKPTGIVDLCTLVHQSDPERLCGGGGYKQTNNTAIGKGASIDVLLFDTNSAADSAKLYDQYAAAGVTNKPMVNVEVFGNSVASSGTPGIFSDAQKKNYYDQVTQALSRDGLSVFFHNTLYCQGGTDPGGTIHYELGGDGTAKPGIRWYFDHLKTVLGL